MIKILILFFYLLLLTLSTSREGTNCKVKTLSVLSIVTNFNNCLDFKC